MRLGILADIHGDLEHLRTAIDVFQREQIDQTVLLGDVIEPHVAAHHGRLVKLTGDGFLAEFSSVENAVTCAILVQDRLSSSPLDFRIGVHLGDVIDDGADIHGEGVNIAARIEALAEPGGISVSAAVYDGVRNRVSAGFEDTGEHSVKNVSAPIRVYRVIPADGDSPTSGGAALSILAPNKPSIAVLPFNNLSNDPEQEFLADGIAEDLITALSRFRSLIVIART